MSFGLRPTDLEYIRAAVSRFPEIEKAVIFGSRAKGTSKPGSDVDLAIWGGGISLTTVARLHALLEDESPMPYFFDIVDYTHLGQAALREEIDRVGRVIFVR
ncbi:MAG: nucleotidyltransferase domain-containing protein [Bacillota bacterium]|jgi:predicted nucleotidyltransferase